MKTIIQKQQAGIYWTNSKEVANRLALRGFHVQGMNGVRGFHAYIFFGPGL